MLRIRVIAVVACTALVATSNVLMLPATAVGVIAAVAGVRLVARDLESARKWFGVALIVSCIVGLMTFMTGNVVLMLAAAASCGLFAWTWHLCNVRISQQREQWALKQRVVFQRQAELDQRRHQLRTTRPEQHPRDP